MSLTTAMAYRPLHTKPLTGLAVWMGRAEKVLEVRLTETGGLRFRLLRLSLGAVGC